MTKPFVRLFVAALLVVAAIVLTPHEANAQACAVTISIATTGTTSSTCFVPANSVAYVNLTGSWAGTAVVERSNTAGAAFAVQESATVNTAFTLPPRTTNAVYQVRFQSRTSGTLTGTIIYNPVNPSRIKYSNIVIGHTAYSSLGTSVSVAFSTSLMISDLVVPQPFSATGMAALIGATTGTNTIILSLYDASGGLVANTAVAGTTTGTANAFQEINFTGGPINVPAGRYYCGLQMNGTTDKYRAIATATFVDVIGGTVTGAAFGTMLPAITPPTTLTADKGPICYVFQ